MDKVLKDLERFGVKSDDETYFVEEQPERNKMIKKNKISCIIFFIIYLTLNFKVHIKIKQ